MKPLTRCLLLVILMAASGSSFADEMVVVVHRESPVQTLTRQQVRRIYQGKKTLWPNGQRIEPIDLQRDDRTRAVFSREIFSKDVDTVERAYLKRVLSGVGQPPVVMSKRETLRYVGSNPAAIGYLDPADTDETVKMIEIQ